MREIGAFDAKTHLSKLLDAVMNGERIAITRRGKPVAMLVPLEGKSLVDPKNAIARLRALRRGLTWAAADGMSIQEAVKEGRR